MFKIVHREELGQGTVILNEIEAPLIAKKAKPGQFVILKANETGERIPLTMADTNLEKGTITIVYMIIGRSTATFADLKVGDSFMDVIGPLGRPTHLEKVGKVVCVGGGTGVAVLHPITRALKEIGNDVTAITGARNKDLIILEDLMTKASNTLHICTDDGSYGHHGFVTDILKEKIENEDIKMVVAIGPVPMMRAVAEMTRPQGIHTLVSLNPIMVDGTGMCGCCRVSVGGETKFACVDGPEFDAHKVDFGELMLRLHSYTEMEKQSYAKFKGEK
ncbi:sulfide/dihydroorotate dehydrogenase-like FAD/NAD-binding protein [Desulforhopalus vacuolatus]|uniref:sulfide/dihydroorotate dehydrogenase-like FAD/NAD-binding protein n=1 Tax=Desulforhopalus vacuolatus TaxID=40414 RepID=UPI001962E49E|nr:sulfide/dihydroorotate dehydrogenase-like FAD/NAD-binding protein [Desulforhopalus vacuolatus]MBM9519484.1 sulfide/dihydroorotate dehydrogenase-like FAD/NAD-binding protein [Desulforhopalus vacuolatus]